jgi:AsmA-like C-terminal region
MSSRWKSGIAIVGGMLLLLVAVLIVASIVVARRARVFAEDWLTQQYNSKVELAAFRVSIPFPLVQCEGENLVLHFEGRQDLPPLIGVTRFTMRTSLWGLLHSSRRIDYLHLDGLQINIPPREAQTGGGPAKVFKRKFRSVRVGEIVSENAVLRILTFKPGKDPLEFDITHLRLNSSTNDGALNFVATLSNPKPPGEIVTSGTFGPWNPEAPRLTPVSGKYDFEKADLGVFPGIAGILSSRGDYQGVLEEIRVDGTTDTPDFRVTRAGHPLDLSTSFHATVDGTDGDTYLQPVEAHFGQTTLLAQGSVEGTRGQKGKIVTLELSASRARIEDLLLLAVRESPSMTGPIRLKTKFILEPGPKEIPDRLNLNGYFELGSVHFTSGAVQQKIDNLSKRSRGKPKDVVKPEEATSADDVATAMNGKFQLDAGILSLALLNFSVPGADVRLDGTYSLGDEMMDLHGKVKLQAKLSQTTTGAKSFLLKLADPLFSRQGTGALLPIKITGPVHHPQYGLDLGRKDPDSVQSR